jgi:hypothetical protein
MVGPSPHYAKPLQRQRSKSLWRNARTQNAKQQTDALGLALKLHLYTPSTYRKNVSMKRQNVNMSGLG